MLYGLDHSPEMIKLSSKINNRAIEKKRLKLIQASVNDIKLDNAKFDLITSFETVQFWSDIDKSFLVINRLLEIGGHFLIINRYPSEGTKWWKKAKIKSDKEYISKLEKAGFTKISVDMEFKNQWIIVDAKK